MVSQVVQSGAAESATDLPLLSLRGISKRFGAVQALASVDFDVYRSQVVALVGDNGAGKSTLIKIISGAEKPDEGRIEVEQRSVSIHQPDDASKLGIATVYQDLALCENLDVVANLHLGREVTLPALGPLGWMNGTSMERAARELLRGLGVNIPEVRRAVAVLSGGQRQSIAVARTLLGNTKVILLDEPTAALGVAQTHQVLALISELRERGLGVVLVSHNLGNVFAVADRAVVLFLGRNNGVFDDLSRISQEEIVAAITGVDSKSHNSSLEADSQGTARRRRG